MAGLLAIVVLSPASRGAEDQVAARFRDEIQPVLADRCYACHGGGIKKGGVSLEQAESDETLLRDRTFWWKVLKNVRAGIMPPAKQPRPTAEEVRLLEDWVKRGVFGLDPSGPDPGRVTIRRLNRVEYRNTIRDLLSYDFRADEEFPPDDTGYGFDNIGDVLTVSPLLLEKYIQAAESIVASAVPTISKVVPVRTFTGSEFRGESFGSADRMSLYKPAKVSREFKAEHAGTYHLVLQLRVKGEFNFDPGRCRLVFKAGDRELLRKEFGWASGKTERFEFTEKWQAGAKPLTFELEPLTAVEKKKSSVDMRVVSVEVEGPLEKEHWVRPKNFDRIFTRDDPKTDPERRRYAREVLGRFATRAFRRPVDEPMLDRLVAMAEGVYRQPGKSVEQGIAQAMVVVLASPRFLFRVERAEPGEADRPFGLVDEFALASRLSYFLWSTMPDEELLRLAGRGELRKNQAAQVRRMLADPRAEMLFQNFPGQWLQARDVDGIAIEARAVLARDDGEEKALKKEMEEFRALLARRQAEAAKAKALAAKGQTPPRPTPFVRPRFLRKPRAELDEPLKVAMRRETEMFFASVVRDDRSVLDLLDSDYTFLNEKLAKHYGVPGVTGSEMRRVSLPKDSPRGGLLTQGTVLVVTSNPTRTSPVKRGLFLLDNILGTPPPPPPPDLPLLEESEKGFKDKEPSLREVLAVHRAKPLCSSCHSRMDPLGLALENFNAMGMWREKERGQPLDTEGTLITGEPFKDVRDLKRILKNERRLDFYRCLTEKLLTYALGRGLEYYDVETVDRIVDRLEREGGRFSALLTGVIESAPFQKRRNVTAAPTSAPARAAGRLGPTDPTTALP
jgi:hypothetical protein